MSDYIDLTEATENGVIAGKVAIRRTSIIAIEEDTNLNGSPVCVLVLDAISHREHRYVIESYEIVRGLLG